jgi:hypothetical protein
VNKILGGWSIDGITTFGSGDPYDPQLGNPGSGTSGTDWANIGARRQQPAVCIGPVNSPTDRANIRKQPVLYLYFNVQNVLVPPEGTLGNWERNSFVGPGVYNGDMSLQKQTNLRERFGIRFRADFFNIWNHAQFNLPDEDPLDAGTTYGRITSANAPREIQLSLKVLF